MHINKDKYKYYVAIYRNGSVQIRVRWMKLAPSKELSAAGRWLGGYDFSDQLEKDENIQAAG